MVALTRFFGGISSKHFLNPLGMFNFQVLEQHAGRARAGRNFNTSEERSSEELSLLM
jgi:hypothetical protein